MTNSSDSLALALCDVRKAYRLLHGYHRRVLDVAAMIAEHFPKTGWLATEFCCSPMTRRRNPFDQGYWMWDATPMVEVNFLFAHHSSARGWETHHRGGDYLLDVGFIAESEFFDTRQLISNEPDPDLFSKSAEDSKSYVRICVARPVEDQKGNTWMQIWHDNEYAENEGATEWSESKYRAYSEAIQMEQLVDADTVASVAKRFKAQAFSALQMT